MEILAGLLIYLSNHPLTPELGGLPAQPIQRVVLTRSRSQKSQTRLDPITILLD
jgi:hypothetical protein